MSDVVAALRNFALREAARILVKSSAFRRHLGSFDPLFDPHFLRAAGLLRNAPDEEAIFVRDLVNSMADSNQTLWVLHETRYRRSGYFVEFGATDGIELSSTYPLERDLGWTGILAEPNPVWHERLDRNRTSAIDHRCVFTRTGERVKFAATRYPALSTISDFRSKDGHAKSREEHRIIDVETVSLNDLLAGNNAPRNIDYVSIDTEGSELSILEQFDFDKWDVGLFSIERNFTAQEHALDELLFRNGYERRFPRYSSGDAWYRKRRS
jgi:FkbM family methyltransferase